MPGAHPRGAVAFGGGTVQVSGLVPNDVPQGAGRAALPGASIFLEEQCFKHASSDGAACLVPVSRSGYLSGLPVKPRSLTQWRSVLRCLGQVSPSH